MVKLRVKEWEVYKPPDTPSPSEVLPGALGNVYDGVQYWALPNILINENTRIIAKYEEVIGVPVFTFKGTVDPFTFGETVTITVTLPDSTTTDVTTAVQDDGSFNATYNAPQIGSYKAKAAVVETDDHLAGESPEVTFEVTSVKPAVTITLTVEPTSQPEA